MRIYVDIDDVLCETARALCQLAARFFDRHVSYEDVHDFNLQRVFCLSDDEMTRFIELSHEPKTLMTYPETPDAVKSVRQLMNDGAEVNLLTGRPASSHVATTAWLASLGLTDVSVEYVNKYARTYERREGDPPVLTMDEIAERKYDIAIDDSPIVLQSLAEWTSTRILVFDRPWNHNFPLAPNMSRVRSWSEITTLLASFSFAFQ